MARTMSSAMLAAFTSGIFQPVLFLEATFQTGPVYLFTGIGTITWSGQTWSGIGTFGGITPMEENASVEAKGITISTSAFDPAWLSAVLGEFQLKAPVIVYIGAFQLGTSTVLGDPLVAWAGLMDQPVIDIGGKSAQISISCEEEMIDMNVASVRRCTNDDQQLDFPGDNGKMFINGIMEVQVYWGVSPLSANNV